MTSVSAYELEIEQRKAANRLRLQELQLNVALETLTEQRAPVEKKSKVRVVEEAPRRVSARLAAKDEATAQMDAQLVSADQNLSGKENSVTENMNGNDQTDPDYRSSESEGKCGFADDNEHLGTSMASITMMTNDGNDY